MLSEIVTADFTSLLVVSALVGVVIGLTGMGGGALMTPALIFLGIPPTTAVANDLVAAVANKSVGAFVHWRRGSPNLQMAKWLIIGSVPFALAGAFIIDAVGGDVEQQSFVKVAIGVALLLASATYVLRILLHLLRRTGTGAHDPTVRPLPTFLVGAVGGLLVGITSVGSGSLIMVALLLLYPTLRASRLVGTDLVQAIPLVFAAALGHVIVSGVDWGILVPLVIGGMPGTYIGARLANWVPQSIIRRGIAIVLTLTGLTLLGVPPTVVGIIAACMLILGPVVWGFVRRAFGRVAFDAVTLSGRRLTVDTGPRLAAVTSPDHEAARRFADAAGDELLRVRAEAASDPSAAALKDRGDAAGQAALAKLLSEHYPHDAVLSEEARDNTERLQAQRVWIIDPLDGTREFSEIPRDDWAVHVALWERGHLCAGAVALPARRRTFSTDQDPAPLPERPTRTPLRLAVSRSRPPAFVSQLADQLGAELIPMGSAGVKAMSVIAGSTDAYVHAGGQFEWDSAAPVAVARAHGLHCSRIDGSALKYNRADPWLPDLVICRPELATEILDAIAACLRRSS